MNIFFQWLSGLVTIILYLFPTSDPNIEAIILSSTGMLRRFLLTVGYFFPVNLFLAYVAIVLTTEAITLAFKITSWILSIISLGFYKKP